MHTRRPLLAAAATLVCSLPGWAVAGIAPAAASKDNTLYEDPFGLVSNGAGPHTYVGQTNGSSVRRGVMAFDIASVVPVGATINSATLTLNCSMSSGSLLNVSIELHRLTADWGEGTSNAGTPGGSGAPSTPGDATWIHRFFNTTNWTTAGGDFVGTVSASRMVQLPGFYSFSGAQLLSDVQAWHNGSLPNFGWILLGDEVSFGSAKRFDTKDNLTPSRRPALSMDYTPLTQVWNFNGGGDWFDPTKWTGGAPNSTGALARLGGIISAPSTINLTAAAKVGILEFDNTFKYTIDGAGTLTLDDASAGGARITVSSGSHDIRSPLQFQKDATVSVGPSGSALAVFDLLDSSVTINKQGGGAFIANRIRSGALVVGAGVVSVSANGADIAASKVGTLVLGGGAAFDLNDNDLIVASNPLASVQAAIVQARNGGAWDQPGLTSSSARNANPAVTTLGVMPGADYESIYGAGAIFAGFPVATTDVLVKYTYAGDADFNGAVDFDDYVRTDNGFNSGLSGWSNGDFDLNDAVDFDDYVLIDSAFNGQNGTLINSMNWLTGDDCSRANASLPGVQKVIEHYQRFGLDYANAFISSAPEPVTLTTVALLAAAVRRRR